MSDWWITDAAVLGLPEPPPAVWGAPLGDHDFYLALAELIAAHRAQSRIDAPAAPMRWRLKQARARVVRARANSDEEQIARMYWLSDRDGAPVFVNGRRIWSHEMAQLTSETGDVHYEVRATTGGRRKSQPLIEHADSLLTAWERYRSAITQQNVAGTLGVGLETVGDWFRGGRWQSYKRTGKLPD